MIMGRGGGVRVREREGCGEGEGVCLLLEAFAIYVCSYKNNVFCTSRHFLFIIIF